MAFSFGVGQNQPRGRGTAGQTPDLVVNGQFLQGTQNWVLTAGWAYSADPRGIAHSAGITTLEQDCTGAVLDDPDVIVDVYVSGITAGSCTVKAGAGATGTSISTNGWHQVTEAFTTDKVLTFTPTTDFDGTIEVVRARAVK